MIVPQRAADDPFQNQPGTPLGNTPPLVPVYRRAEQSQQPLETRTETPVDGEGSGMVKRDKPSPEYQADEPDRTQVAKELHLEQLFEEKADAHKANEQAKLDLELQEGRSRRPPVYIKLEHEDQQTLDRISKALDDYYAARGYETVQKERYEKVVEVNPEQER